MPPLEARHGGWHNGPINGTLSHGGVLLGLGVGYKSLCPKVRRLFQLPHVHNTWLYLVNDYGHLVPFQPGHQTVHNPLIVSHMNLIRVAQFIVHFG